ncbi:MAG: RNA methyltransferase [Myxococcales bacterium]|nr:RNA methyltransferase [Myxococcales bacterium]
MRVEQVEVARRVMAALKPYVSTERQARIREVLAARTRDVTVVLEDLANTHNGAAVLRTADAMGLMEVHLVPKKGARFRVSPKVAKGAFKWLDTILHPSIEASVKALRGRGFQIWVSSVTADARPVHEVPVDVPLALLFGNEHEGVSQNACALADGRFHVPMYGFVESLNVSVAAALTLAEVLRSKRARHVLSPLGEEERIVAEAVWYARSVRAAPELLGHLGIHVPSEWIRQPILESER